MAKEKWIGKATAKMERKGTVGAFSAQAKKAGMTTRAFAGKVLANPNRYSPTTVQRANFARNVAKSAKKRK